MEQLVFELAAPSAPRLSNFLPGRNAELVAALKRFVAGGENETGMLIWGAPAAGKTHLLAAAIAHAQERGMSARLFEHPDAIDERDVAAAIELVAIDRIDEASPAAAGRIFTLYNALKSGRARLLAASRTPLATMRIREDLRTRLGWGLVYEIVALDDAEKSAALDAYARQRGFSLSPDVIEYLLRHGKRDMGSLLAVLSGVDRMSLSSKRAITVPLLREWLQRELDWAQRESTGLG